MLEPVDSEGRTVPRVVPIVAVVEVGETWVSSRITGDLFLERGQDIKDIMGT